MPKKNLNNNATVSDAPGQAPFVPDGNSVLPAVKRSRFKFWAVFVLVMIFVVGSLVYVFKVQRDSRLAREELNKIKNSPQELAKQETERLLSQLEKLIVLPGDEQPTIATVTDIDKLKDQPFFVNGKVGDKVIIYTQAQKAILFRPAESKIVEVAPFVGSPQIAKAAVAGETISVLTVEIRNGSGRSGVAGNLKTELEQTGKYQIVKVGNAAKVYGQSLVVYRDKASQAAAQDLAKSLGGVADSSLPESETGSQAEVLIIIGKE